MLRFTYAKENVKLSGMNDLYASNDDFVNANERVKDGVKEVKVSARMK